MQSSLSTSQFRRTRVTPSLTAWPPQNDFQSKPEFKRAKQNHSISVNPSKPPTANFHINLSAFGNKKILVGNHQTPLPKLTEYQGSKTSRWAGLATQIARPDLVEENQCRTPKVKVLLQEFLQQKDALIAAMASMEREKPESIAKFLATSEAILALYNIGLHVPTEPKADSLWELGPLGSRNELVKGFFALVPEICKFPYSFYTKIDLVSLTFCGSMGIIKINNKRMVENRLAHGIFPLHVFKNEEKLVSHFYKVIVHHLKTEVTDFDRKLVFSKDKDPKDVLAAVMGYGIDSVKRQKDIDTLEESGKLLRNLIQNPTNVLESDSQVLCSNGNTLRDMLETVDPSGINKTFWASLGYKQASVTFNELPKKVYLSVPQ